MFFFKSHQVNNHIMKTVKMCYLGQNYLWRRSDVTKSAGLTQIDQTYSQIWKLWYYNKNKSQIENFYEI